MAWAVDSITNPHLNDDFSVIIPFTVETFGLWGMAIFRESLLDQGEA
jgi:cellulose biosynthesis protein BcsQ